MRVIVLILFIIVQHGLAKVQNKVATVSSYYQISMNENENFMMSQAPNSQMGVLTSSKGRIIFVAKEFEPQSINSVKKRAIEEGVRATDVKIKKYKDRSLFYFETNEFYNVYSTLGGHLLISKNKKNIFDFAKLNLKDQRSRKVVRL